MSTRCLRPSRAVVAVLLAAGWASARAVGFQEAPQVQVLDAPGARASLQVSAHTDAWQSTGALLRAGVTYHVSAEGRWQVGPTRNPTGPDGVTPYTLLCWDAAPRAVSTATHSTLIARIGHDGQPFAIGTGHEFTAGAEGVLYLMCNDSEGWFFDNTGQVSAQIAVVSAPAATAPPRDSTQIIIRQENSQGGSGTVEIRRGGGGGGGGGGKPAQ